MIKKIDKKYLIYYESKIAALFINAAKIRAPIHLYSGNEDEIIKVFKNIKKMIGYFAHGEVIINVY